MDDLDMAKSGDAAYLMGKLQKLSKQFARSREGGIGQEQTHESAVWGRSRAQKKAARFQSFAKHLSDDARRIVQDAAFRDHTFEQRRKAIAKRKAEVASQWDLLHFAEKELEKKTQEAASEYALAQEDHNKLRNELLGTNPALEAVYTEINETIRAAIAANVEANVAMGLAQDKLEWLHERAQRQQALNKKEKDLELRFDRI
jgi:hypothetical protein